MRIIKRDCGVSRTENITMHNGRFFFTDFDHGDCFEYFPRYGNAVFRKAYASLKKPNRTFGAIAGAGNDIYLIPFLGNKMFCLNTETWETEDYSFEIGSEIIGALSAHYLDGKIYIVSDVSPIIIEFDCVTKRIETYYSEIDMQTLDADDIEAAYFRTSMLMDGKIYMPSCKANLMAIFDTETKETAFQRFGEEHLRYSAVCFADGLFYLAQRRGREIVCWDPNKDETTLFFKNMPEDDIKYSFSNILCNDKYIIASPLSGRGLYLIDRATKEEFVLFEEIRCANICCDGMMLYISDLYNNMIIEVNTEDMSYHKNILWLSETITEQLRMSNNLQNGAFLKEKGKADLINYMNALVMY